MHSLHKIAKNCQAYEDDTVGKQSSLIIFLIDWETFKIVILSFAKKHFINVLSSNLVFRQYTQCIGEFATASDGSHDGSAKVVPLKSGNSNC